MANLNRICFFLCLFSATLLSCKKANNHSDNPQEEVLLANQIREEYGLRFILTWSVADSSDAQTYAPLDLTLFKGAGASKSTTPLPLTPKESAFKNYSILTSALDDGGEYTLTINFGNVTKNGSFDLYVEGYTAIREAKKFTLANNPFTTAQSNSRKDYLIIKREGSKYTFTSL